ncbi:MAG: FGGY family carbohydrate kinase [Pseudomonadota bacterium]
MSEKVVLAIDVGSQSTRAALVNAGGELLAFAKKPSPPIKRPAPGGFESEADAFFDDVLQTARNALAEAPGSATDVGAVVLCAQRGTTVFCDAHGRPLHPAVLWCDERHAEDLTPLPFWLRCALPLIRADSVVEQLRRRSPANRMRHAQSHVYGSSDRIALLSSWLVFRLTGRWIDSTASQVGFVPFDFRRHRWYPPTHWRWRALALKPSQLPDLVAPGEVLGPLSASVADAVGLPRETNVIAAATDKACEVLGSGAVDPRDEVISLGTAAALVRPSHRFRHIEPFRPAFPSACPGRYLLETQIDCGMARITALMDSEGLNNRAIEQGWIDDTLRTIPAGAGGLRANSTLPARFSPSEGIYAQAFDARPDEITPAAATRALLEGLALELRQVHNRFSARFGAPDRVLLGGGGAQSPAFVQLLASVLNRPLRRPVETETGVLGAAMCAAPLVWSAPSIAHAATTMSCASTTINPVPELVRFFDRL